MSLAANTLLRLPVREAIGAKVAYVSPKTKRERKGEVISVAFSGVRVENLDKVVEFVNFRDLLQLLDRKEAK
jgi:hypothetical protein